MLEHQWRAFCNLRDDAKEYYITSLKLFGAPYTMPHKEKPCIISYPLKNAIEQCIKDDGDDYAIDNPIVYNHNLDLIKKNDVIKLILVGDNPGKEEQKHSNQCYLVGQAGRIADGFFTKHNDLGINFRQNVIILNKTILHTPKTLILKKLIKKDKLIEDFFISDQLWQGRYAFLLQRVFDVPIWIVGYSQLTEKGLFASYANTIKKEIEGAYTIKKEAFINCASYPTFKIASQPVFLYQHFSMNCFIKQLKKESDSSFSLKENLEKLGLKNRKMILGF